MKALLPMAGSLLMAADGKAVTFSPPRMSAELGIGLVIVPVALVAILLRRYFRDDDL